MTGIKKATLFVVTLLVGVSFAGITMATDYNVNTSLCTVYYQSCAPKKTVNINVAVAGNYSLKVTVERGNDISKYECQDKESFYMIVNGKKTPVIKDPNRCERQGTIKTQSVSGKYYLKKGNNVIKFYHAYTLAQTKSRESLIIKTIKITRIPNPIDGRCGSSNGKTFNLKPTVGLCSVGSATSVLGIGPWNWRCLGSDGGKTVNCLANITFPECGSSNGKTFSYKPTTNLCKKGTATAVKSGINYTWQCVNGLKKVFCSANKYCAVCGNEKIDTNEQCDNGSDNGKLCVPEYGKTCSYCSTSCKLITLTGGNCGNGKIENGEQCDDGNNTNGDGCSATCSVETPKPICGNNILENDEQCDDGNNLNGDGCSAVCDIEKPEPKPEPEPEPEPEPTPTPKSKKCKGSIGNYIWLDADEDGNQDAGEQGIGNIRLKLKWAGKDDKWGNSDDKTWKTDTNHNGRYIFDKLCEGKYKLYVNDNDVKKYTQTYDPDNEKNNKTKITLDGNKGNHTKADFGYNKKQTTPATGSGATALYLSGLLSSVGWLSYRQYKGKLNYLKK